VSCEVEYTDEFEHGIAAVVEVLAAKDTRLGIPYSSGIEGSQFSHMRELRLRRRK
jgi:hypothetical protein